MAPGVALDGELEINLVLKVAELLPAVFHSRYGRAKGMFCLLESLMMQSLSCQASLECLSSSDMTSEQLEKRSR